LQVTDSASQASDPELAVRRWTLGHQIFHYYLVAMITILDELNDLDAPSEERSAQLLRDLAELFGATAASMKYASNFDRDVYDRVIRPTMAPPIAKPGFSGLLNVDHERMMALLVPVPDALKRRFGEETSSWPAPIAEAWHALVDAEQQARYDHGFVCRRLVVEGPSLLRQHMAGKSKETAEEVWPPPAFTRADGA
jgi:hypothetical protein